MTHHHLWTVLCIIFLGAALTVALHPAPPLGSAAETGNLSECHPPMESPAVTATVTLTNTSDGPASTSSVRVTYTVTDSVSRFELDAGPVSHHRGFTQTNDTLVWDGSTAPSIVISPAAVSQHTTGLPQQGATWTLFDSIPLTQRWRTPQTTTCTDLFQPSSQAVFTSESAAIVATDQMVYVGTTAPTRYQQSLVANRTLQLVVPPETSLSGENVTPMHLTAAINQTSAQFQVGCHRNLTVFAIPVPDRGETNTRAARFGGLTIRSGDQQATAWVDADTPRGVHGNIWLHEYTHTRQCFQTTPEMKWVVEGSAQYYETILPYRQANTTQEQPAVGGVAFQNVTLTAPGTWSSTRTPYEKGATAIFYLDYQLRTHGNHTFDDVLAWMNARDQPVTYDAFRQHVVAWTDAETGAWMDAHIAGNESITVPPPVREQMARELGQQPADGDQNCRRGCA